jgi:ribosomal protein L22
VKSARDNAMHDEKTVSDNLYIKRIDVGRWPKIKRVRFSSRSRISHYEKYRACVKVVLDNK